MQQAVIKSQIERTNGEICLENSSERFMVEVQAA